MGEPAQDEHRHTQQQRQHLTFAGKLHGGGHDESAAHGQQCASQRPLGQSTSQDLGSRLNAIGLGIANHGGHECTAHDVAYQHHEQHGPVAMPTDEACRACVELQLIVDHGGQSESEEHGSGHSTYSQVDHASY